MNFASAVMSLEMERLGRAGDPLAKLGEQFGGLERLRDATPDDT